MSLFKILKHNFVCIRPFFKSKPRVFLWFSKTAFIVRIRSKPANLFEIELDEGIFFNGIYSV